MNTGKRLMRPMSDRWLAGVCSGIANYFGWDVAILRLVYLVLTLCTAFSGIIIYIILWICMPEDNN